MIDLHCHIIPHLDDGAFDAHVSCQMARHLLQCGVRTVVATPHSNLEGTRTGFLSPLYWQRFGLFRALLRQARIPLRVLPGSELLADPSNLAGLLRDRLPIPLNGTDYLLVEFAFSTPGAEITAMLDDIRGAGYRPVVAHPERYYAVQEQLRWAEAWFDRGYVLQINKGSLLDRLGRSAFETSNRLLARGMVDVIASDAHDMRMRPPGFQTLLPILQRLCTPEYVRLLLDENPNRILKNRTVREAP